MRIRIEAETDEEKKILGGEDCAVVENVKEYVCIGVNVVDMVKVNEFRFSHGYFEHLIPKLQGLIAEMESDRSMQQMRGVVLDCLKAMFPQLKPQNPGELVVVKGGKVRGASD